MLLSSPAPHLTLGITLHYILELTYIIRQANTLFLFLFEDNKNIITF